MQDHNRLTEGERDSIRAYLKSFMRAHPARAPFGVRARDWAEAILLGESGSFGYARLAGAACVLMLSAGSGISYAAESALPGQALYSVKVNINEKVAGAMAVSPVAKAQFDAGLTARRLEEAELLAAANELTPEVGSEIQARIDKTTASFNGNLAKLAESADGADAATDVQTELEATLSAHANVLAALSETVPETKHALAPIISSVEGHVATAREAREARSNAITVTLSVGSETSDDTPARTAAAKKKESAQAALGRVQALVDKTENTSGASSSAPIAERAQQVGKAVEQADAYLENGEYDKASNVFQTAIRAAHQTEAEATMSLQLQKILPTLTIGSTSSIDLETAVEIGGVLGTSTAATTTVIIQEESR